MLSLALRPRSIVTQSSGQTNEAGKGQGRAAATHLGKDSPPVLSPAKPAPEHQAAAVV